MYTLFILMRSDLESLNPGKMAAQATHAANDFQSQAQEIMKFEFKQWCGETDEPGCWKAGTFGTTIVLDGKTEEHITNAINDLDSFFEGVANFNSGIITDSSYPLKDGTFTHLIPLVTCAWIFVDRDLPQWKDYSKKWKLGLLK